MNRTPSRALLLSGGGARAAYQAGVLKYVCEISRESSGKIPFEILVGVSAGAINMSALATNAHSMSRATDIMTDQWASVRTEKIFRTNISSFAMAALRWLVDLTLGGAIRKHRPKARSLVDTAPLREILERLLPPGRVAEHVRNGILEGVAISAMDYSSGDLTVFTESSRERTAWRRFSRKSVHAVIGPEHILASCALPFLFPAVRIGNSFYGDGSIHNMAPISPAIHLGARKVLAIGVRAMGQPRVDRAIVEDEVYPSPAVISAVLLDSIFMDSLEADREQMERINDLLARIPYKRDDTRRTRRTRLRSVDFMSLGPSAALPEVALAHRHEMPRTVRYMLKGIGAEQESGAELISYMLFESGYCSELMDLGYRDAKERRAEIEAFLWE